MQLNKDIEDILQKKKIDKNVGMMYLLSIYHRIENDIIPSELKRQINAAKIVERDFKDGTLVWNLPLYEGQEIAFAWVQDWNDRFGIINPSRKGDLKTVMARMKEFFSKNPEVRKDDVIAATDLYFTELSAPSFLKFSHKFIYEGSGATKASILGAYVERIIAAKQNTSEIDHNNFRGRVVN